MATKPKMVLLKSHLKKINYRIFKPVMNNENRPHMYLKR